MARKDHRGGGHWSLIIAAAVWTALAFETRAAEYCLAHDTSHYMQSTLNTHARAVLLEGEKYLQAQSIGLIRLLNASTKWQDRGQRNYGVFEISGPQGESVVLKISDGEQYLVRSPHSGLLLDFTGEFFGRGPLNVGAAIFKEYIDVHTILGRIFAAPKLIAVLPPQALKSAFNSNWAAMKEAAEKFEFESAWLNRSRFAGSQAVGIVMQKLPRGPEQGPVHPVSRPTQPPPFMAAWSSDNLVTAVRDMIEIRRRVLIAGVDVIDQQFVVTPSARAYLIDLDLARFSSAPHLDISYEILKLVDQWQSTTGQQLSLTLKFELLDEATIPHPICRSDEDFKDLLSDWRCEDPLNAFY